jgi:hypothetical protein
VLDPTEVLDAFFWEQLNAIPALSGVRVVGLPVLPQTQAVTLPAIAYYPEQSVYPDGTLGVATNYATGRYAIKAMCKGTSTNPIRPLSAAIKAHFETDTPTTDYEHEGENYHVTLSLNSQLLPTTVVDGSTIYRQLGSVFDFVLVHTGG